MKELRRPSTLFLPKPVALIGSARLLDGRVEDNLMTAAWVNAACMDPPMLSVAVHRSRYTHTLIEEGGEFTVNLPGEELLAAVEACGSFSGREGDKFARAGLAREAAARVSAPLVAECPVNVECVVRRELALGSHTLFVGEVLAVHVDGSVSDGAGHLKAERIRPFVLNHREYWGMGERIGSYGSGAPPFKLLP